MAQATRHRPSNIVELPTRNSRRYRTVLRGIVVCSWFTWAVPWPIWHLLSSALGLAFMFTRRRRQIAFTNIRHVRNQNPPSPPVAWYLGAQQISTHSKTVIGTLQAGVRLPDPATRLEFKGAENILHYLGQRGIIVVAPHTGPYPTLGLMANDWLRERGFQGELAVVARLFKPFRSGALMDWFVRCFARSGARIIPVDQSPLRMASQLRSVLDANGIIVLFVDEPTPTPSAVIPFFDSAIKLPIGPVRLAQATGSIIIPCVVTFGKGRNVTAAIQPPIEPVGTTTEMLTRIAQALEPLIDEHLDQWAMLTPVWLTENHQAPNGHSYADLHLHTTGSDGLLEVDAWVAEAEDSSIAVLAITDHDHLTTIRDWHAAKGEAGKRVIPGVEITARGRIVHVSILFPEDVPTTIPKAGTPLVDIVRWARTIPGSIVILVHPLPFLWRGQLQKLARADLLPDAIETQFPLVGWRSGAIEQAAEHYGLAKLGGSDAHLMPKQLGRYVTQFPGETADDLIAAIRARTTKATVRPARVQVPISVYGLQCVYSWLLPFQRVPLVKRARARLLRRAQAVIAAQTATEAATEPDPAPEPIAAVR